jgi:hypothetical protein
MENQMETGKQNKMCLNIKDVPATHGKDAVEIYKEINLADDFQEVRGFGQPIAARLAKKMSEDYYKDYTEIQDLFNDINNNKIETIEELQKDERYTVLQDLLARDRHIISGVFGKEIILQLLAQKDCEGIRYIIGKSCAAKSRTAIMLMGVKEADGFEKDIDGICIKRSMPVPGRKINVPDPCDHAKNEPRETAKEHPDQSKEFDMSKITPETPLNPNDPLTGEVHRASKTVADIEEIMNRHPELYSKKKPSDVLFEIY